VEPVENAEKKTKPAPVGNRTKRTSPIEVRLVPDDLKRFDILCVGSGRNRAQVAREAILWYMDQQDKIIQDSRESKLEARMRKMENRMAALISRGNIDTGVILEIIYSNMPVEDKEAALKKCHKRAAMRLKGKIAEVEDIEELFRKELAKAEAHEA
jgi:hypothetical protein